MNGALQTMQTLLGRGVDTCFANPGTSEMHFVAALDRAPGMRGVLALFEGVATGAADGYGRMTGRPAAVLLHLGPGLGNGLANLHNARRARTPVVAVVGEHATDHRRFDPPLTTDIEGMARPVSGWVGTAQDQASLASTVDAAVTAASGPPGTVATVVVPADLSWSEAVPPRIPGTPGAGAAAPSGRSSSSDGTGSRGPGAGQPATGASTQSAGAPAELLRRGWTGTALVGDATPPPASLAAVAAALRGGGPTALLVGGRVTHGAALRRAAQVAAHAGAKLLCETFPARLERGAGVPGVERLAYLAELAQLQLAGLRHLVVIDTPVPVSFFAYPGLPSVLVPDGCQVHLLAGAGDDAAGCLDDLAAELGVPDGAPVPTSDARRPARPSGALTPESMAVAVGAVLPEGAVVSDESNTLGLHVPAATAGAPPHDWLTLTGGAIGQGLPVATGAAVAEPGRRVLCLESDGSAMYTIQSLWTQAREGLDVTTVLLDNQAYGILAFELARVGAGTAGPVAERLLDLRGPDLDFVAIARGMGVPASRATTADELVTALDRAMAEPGPALVHVPLPRTL